MTNDNTVLKRYFSDVSKALLCGNQKKRALLNELKENAEEYVLLHDDVTRETLCTVFGTPEEIAASALQGEDLQAIKRKTALKRVILAALILALLIWAVFAVISIIDVHTEAHGYIEEGILRIVSSMIGGLTI